MKTTKSKLEAAVESLNYRCLNNLNEDDQLAAAVKIANNCKGYHLQPLYDTYEVVTDLDRLNNLANKFGYWSAAVKEFNEILKNKGGLNYMQQLNNEFLSEQQ